MWIFITLIACFVLATVNILDKFIVTKTVKPYVFVFYSTIISLPFFLAVPFGVTLLYSTFHWVVAVFSGIAFGIGLWFMYKSFAVSEISHVGPLGGASISICTVLLGRIFLDEMLSIRQLYALLFLVAGSLIISLEQSKKNHGWHIGILWAVVAGLWFASSNVAAKYLYTQYDFYSGFIWTRAFTSIVGVVLLCTPDIWRAVLNQKKLKNVQKQNFFLIGSNKVLGGVGIVLIQYATALGSVSLVNALTGVQYAFLIILTAGFSKFYPSILKEKYTRYEIFQEIIAIVCIAGGILLLV